MNQLGQKLTPREQRDRAQGFTQARQFVDRAAQAGGITAPYSRSFPKIKKDGSSIRVDIEVITGQAFVPEGQDSEV